MSDAEARIRSAIAAHIEQTMRDVHTGSLTCTTADPDADTLTQAKFEAMLGEWGKMLRNARRDQLTIIVDMGHEGPIISHDTPCDGRIVECCWRDAQRIHEHWPLKLHRVESHERAEFVPALPLFGDFIWNVLPMPPFDVPPSEEPE